MGQESQVIGRLRQGDQNFKASLGNLEGFFFSPK